MWAGWFLEETETRLNQISSALLKLLPKHFSNR
jgi:hypothetical protein